MEEKILNRLNDTIAKKQSAFDSLFKKSPAMKRVIEPRKAKTQLGCYPTSNMNVQSPPSVIAAELNTGSNKPLFQSNLPTSVR